MSEVTAPIDKPHIDRRGLLRIAWSVAVLAHVGAAIWVFAHPVALPSDDALYFSRGLTRFSILDLSPQFPGYPGFIALGRLAMPFAAGPVAALAHLTAFIALIIPPISAFAVWRARGEPWPALAAFVLTLTSPLLPVLALSLLSDGSAILFLLVFLSFLPRDGKTGNWPSGLVAGAALAFAFSCRPSDAVLLAGAGLAALLAAPRLFWPALAGALLVLVPTALWIFAHEGWLYVAEGLRFVRGHALIWGNTAFAETAPTESWLDALAALPGGRALALLFAAGAAFALTQFRQIPPILAAAVGGFWAHLIWVAIFQNPEQLRHLAPLAVLGPLVLTLIVPLDRPRLTALALFGTLGLQLLTTAATLDPDPARLPPLAAAQKDFARKGPRTVVATNWGVATLRDGLANARVYDMHYAADARLGLALAKGPAFRLSGTLLPDREPLRTFPARFLGEHGLHVYSKASAR